MRAAILALALLAGCSSAGSDGHRYDQTEFERSSVTVTVVTYPSVAGLRRAAAQMNVTAEGNDIQAFGFVSPTAPICEIHIVEPKRSNDRLWAGHEFMHCIRGRWHG